MKKYFAYIAILGVISLNIYLILLGTLGFAIFFMIEAVKDEGKRIAKNRELNEYLDEAGRLN